MNTNKLLILLTSACVIISGGFFIYKNISTDSENQPSSQIYSKDEATALADTILVQNSSKTTEFSTLEEANAYISSLNTISSTEEAADFITNFLYACESNQINIMASFFEEEHWVDVIQNQVVPAYDITNTYSFKYSNISVSNGDNDNEYIASYTLTVIDNNTQKVHSEFYREDTFLLNKEFEDIAISNYKRNTLDYKTF